MNARSNRWVVAVAIAALILGAILSRVIEPGVRVEKIILTLNTPALRLFPAAPGPRPLALLAHGRLIGHSMGGGIGESSVLKAGFRPKLFIGVGAPIIALIAARHGSRREEGDLAMTLFGSYAIGQCQVWRVLAINVASSLAGDILFRIGWAPSSGTVWLQAIPFFFLTVAVELPLLLLLLRKRAPGWRLVCRSAPSGRAHKDIVKLPAADVLPAVSVANTSMKFSPNPVP